MATQNRIKAAITLAVVAMAFFALTTTSAKAALSDGLVEYWELDGDYSAEVDPTHVGTLQATGTGITGSGFVSGKFGQGIDLESSDSSNQASVVIGGDENDFDFAGGSLSVSLWYTTESLYVSWQCLVGKGEGGSWRVARSSGDNSNLKLSLWIIGDGELDQQDGSWHHVVATVDATDGPRMYVDGSLVASGTGPTVLGDSGAQMQIGGNPQAANRGWDGIIDDVGVWNRVLTIDEVSSIWNDGAGANIGSLVIDDPNAPSVDAGISMITWSGEPVQLDPNVVEAPGSDWTDLTYLWSADPDDGVEFSDASVLAPTVTITKTPVFVPFVANAGFEDPPLDEDDYTWQDVPGWTPIGHADDDEGVGVWNTTIADFDPLIAPEGENVLYTEYYVGGVGGVTQILDEKFAADIAYTLTVDVGNSDYYYFSGYKVQLLAGGTVIAEDNDTLWPGYKLWATSTVAYTYNAADAALVGQPLEIRLLSLGLDKDNPDDAIGVEFDNVTLLIDGESGTYAYDPEPITVILTLAVNDEGREGDPVTDAMTIDVYDDACLAAEAAGTLELDPTDFDGNCITDFADFALMAATWLDDYSLTEPGPK